jgi:hypothetical protein
LCLMLLLLSSCWQQTEVASKKESIKNSLQNQLIDSRRISSQDLPFIISQSSLRQKQFIIPEPEGQLQQIPKDFLNKYIFNLPVTNLNSASIPEDVAEFFYFNEYWNTGELFFFSIVYIDESCCQMVYGITVDKKNNTIREVALLGLSGGDGGWSEDDYGEWINDTTLSVTKPQIFDDLEGNISIDTTWLEIAYNKNGHFHQSTLDSSHNRITVKK